MDKVIVSTYETDGHQEVPEHIIEVPTADEIQRQADLNIANTAQAIRRRVLTRLNGNSPVKIG